MIILPAIDLKEGHAVRLYKGEMSTAKVYAEDPVEVAKKFEEMGATWLHLVDLDGAFVGKPVNLEQIRRIRAATQLKIELGGGIRDEETMKELIDLGVDRLILGSIAAKNPDFIKRVAPLYPIAVSIDAKEGMVAVEGWAKVGSMKASELAAKFADAGVEAVICTDIGRDGTLEGVNVDFTVEIAEASHLLTIASGGVKDLADLKALAVTGKVGGAIVGRAYYEGRINLREAFLLFSA